MTTLHYRHFGTSLPMEGLAVAQAMGVTPENHSINMACSCPSFVMNVELSILCLRQSTVVSVEQNEFNTCHTLQIVHFL